MKLRNPERLDPTLRAILETRAERIALPLDRKPGSTIDAYEMRLDGAAIGTIERRLEMAPYAFHTVWLPCPSRPDVDRSRVTTYPTVEAASGALVEFALSAGDLVLSDERMR